MLRFAHSTLARCPRVNGRQTRHANLGVFLVASVMLAGAGGRSTAGNGYEDVEFAASNAGRSEPVLLHAQLFRPPGQGPFPAVVLMHGCGGWLPTVQRTLQSYARFLVERQFAVLNLDSFGPRKRSGGMVCESLQLLTEARSYRVYDAFDALGYMKSLDFVDADNVFLVGQSNGGSVAITAALRGDPRTNGRTEAAFRAVIAFYPWCGALGGRRITLVSPLLIFAGGQDDWTPPDECARTASSGATLQVKIYPQAAHSFDLDIVPQRYLGKWLGKNEFATKDSRERMLAFFRQHIARAP